MTVRLTETFNKHFQKQVNYIASDKPFFARKFKNELLDEIKKVANEPYRCRKSRYFEDEHCRDLIYKKHTIVFKIESSHILVLDIIYKQRFGKYQ